MGLQVTAVECVGLLALAGGFVALAVLGIRGGQKDDDAWWARWTPMPAGSLRGPVIDVKEAKR